ncbi:MAG: hypothetical protein WBA93_35360 [Microcoleaceae cyanobacterium]
MTPETNNPNQIKSITNIQELALTSPEFQNAICSLIVKLKNNDLRDFMFEKMILEPRQNIKSDLAYL